MYIQLLTVIIIIINIQTNNKVEYFMNSCNTTRNITDNCLVTSTQQLGCISDNRLASHNVICNMKHTEPEAYVKI